jgi:hypothetical protein
VFDKWLQLVFKTLLLSNVRATPVPVLGQNDFESSGPSVHTCVEVFYSKNSLQLIIGGQVIVI